MSKIFDEDLALERTAGDRSLLAEVVRFTLEDVPLQLQSLRQCLAQKDWKEASRWAHKVKGSAGACGSDAMYRAALDLEMATKDSSSESPPLFSSLEKAFVAFSTHPQVLALASLDVEADASIG
ncbi:MAG: Hpt domain-containing protein [Spirochaetales bacterium]|nr:Hpt domain-containing protein [Spirochaetales bacterium]